MQFAAVLRMRRREAVGVAVEWFCWVDAQCTDGFTGLLPAQVDEVMECKRLAEALLAVGWAFVGADGFLYVQDFDQHHGEGAKARALAAERQAKFKLAKGNGGCVTDGNGCGVTGALPRERVIYNDTVVGKDTGDIKGAGVPARTTDFEGDEGFKVWLAGLCGAHPSARRSRVLQPDVLVAAREAYKRCPDAVEHVGLLEAYFGSKQAVDRNKLAFYRPTGQRKFFVDLEDVLCHAERWQREFGWGKKPAKRGKTVVTPGTQVQRCAGLLNAEDAMAFIKGETDVIGG